MIIMLIITNFTFALGIEIYYPNGNQELCSSTLVEIKWNGIASDVDVLVKSEQNSEFQKILNYEVVGNTFKWKVSVEDFFNVPLTFRISNRNNSNEFDEVGGITVFRDIEIIEQTNSLQICEGEDILLDIEAIGYDLKYQWFKDGQMIPDANSQVLYIQNSDYSHSGTYTCNIKSNGICAEKEIAPISVYVATKTKFTSNPKNIFWEYKSSGNFNALLHANINDSNNVKFQWYKDSTIWVVPENGGIPVAVQIKIKLNEGKKYRGTQSSNLAVNNMVWGDRADYFCIADGLCGVDTAVGAIGAQKYFRIHKESPDFYDCEGKDVTFKARVETNETGTFTYQWYKTGLIKLQEGEKFSGTQTLELTIHKPDRKDNSTFYVLVNLVEKQVYDRSESFIFNPEYMPTISEQPKDWVIHAPRNFHIGIIWLKLLLYNYQSCFYEWYKGDSLILKGYNKNGYIYDPLNAKNVKPSDVGWYKCKISNQCGTIWSDSVYVAWGFKNNKLSACLNDEFVITVDEFSDDFYFQWVFKDKVIEDSDRIINSKTNKLTFIRLDETDVGNYSVYVINKNNQNRILMGIIKVEVELPPDIITDFPDTLSNVGDRMPQVSIVANSRGEGLYYILYIDGKAQEAEQFKKRDQYGNIDYGFVLGGSDSNLKPGVYQYRFRNDCGMIWSNKMTVINENYKE